MKRCLARRYIVLGSGGPNLGNVTNFTINWDLDNNGLWQFSMNTNNGIPSCYVDLKTSISAISFDLPEPEVTLSGTDFPGLDGTYYTTLDWGNFVLVAKGASYTIYFSNEGTATDCGIAMMQKTIVAEKNVRGSAMKVYPNPSGRAFNLQVNTIESISKIAIYTLEGSIDYDL